MIGPLKPFSSFSAPEYRAVHRFMDLAEDNGLPLSGYLAGKERGGAVVRQLEDAWAKRFHVKHAIACNSATSGLLAAADAVGLDHECVYACPSLTMSATAAAPRIMGATPYFLDSDPTYFGAHLPLMKRCPEAVFVTSLFGHPADLIEMRRWCDQNGVYMVEDAAQSPFAEDNGRLVGTIGHIGVFSLNVHKPLQAGEGGVIVTDDDNLAKRMRGFINHGENTGQAVGLNLRLSEISAAIALAQLERAGEIISSRIVQALCLQEAIGAIPGLHLPKTAPYCKHVYYTVPFTIDYGIGSSKGDINAMASPRERFCAALREQGVPITEGYTLTHRLPAFAKFTRSLPIVEQLHDESLFYFENCAWDLTNEQIGEIGRAFQIAAEKVL